ncbi:MAG: hypothetical protein J0L82_06405 [Deltaproteobacteria bacterium]|nr:hypothetical protein [Deltaproteobacteria bacterium]
MTPLNTEQQNLPDSVFASTRPRRMGFYRFVVSAIAAVFVLLPGLSNALTCEEWLEGQAARIKSEDVLRDYDASTTLSQQVRDNAPFYWAEAREQTARINWSAWPTILKSDVISVGDLHSGQFSPIHVPGKGVIYTLFDAKDLGYAPALLDINRLVLNTIAIAKRRRTVSVQEQDEIARSIFENYRAGLLREDFQLTEQYREFMPSEKKFNRKLEKKMDNKLDESGQLYVDGEVLQPLSVASRNLKLTVDKMREAIESNLRARLGWGHLLDAIVKVPERGGSKDQIRILVLFKLANGETVMKELKRVGETAIAAYQDQVPNSEIQSAASKYLDYDILVNFPQVKIGDATFTLRDKKVDPIFVPYKQKYPSDFEELMSMAHHHAQWVGTFHGRQLFARQAGSNRVFAEALRDSQPQVINSLNSFNRRHLRTLEERL